MMEGLLNIEQYSLNKEQKQKLLFPRLQFLHDLHLENCNEYRHFSDLFNKQHRFSRIEDFPFVPVAAFKNYLLKSIPDEAVYKVLTSSGTTGAVTSKIILDKNAAQMQTLSLSKIITHILGKQRIPMLIIDSKDVLKNRQSFSARGAGILGLSIFGKNHTYLLDENYQFDKEAFFDFYKQFKDGPIFIFGFTFMIWKHLMENKDLVDVDLSNAILIHSGGWKKMSEIAVDNDTFKQKINIKLGIKRFYNFYGMIEQIGAVFLENSQGYLQCPNFAEILIRNPVDFSIQENGKEGLIQVISALPESYPGFSILTEDIGVCMGEDDAENGWKGKYFKILGRAKKAELRGCSDVVTLK